jgi:hypothetical protein
MAMARPSFVTQGYGTRLKNMQKPDLKQETEKMVEK